VAQTRVPVHGQIGCRGRVVRHSAREGRREPAHALGPVLGPGWLSGVGIGQGSPVPSWVKSQRAMLSPVFGGVYASTCIDRRRSPDGTVPEMSLWGYSILTAVVLLFPVGDARASEFVSGALLQYDQQFSAGVVMTLTRPGTIRTGPAGPYSLETVFPQFQYRGALSLTGAVGEGGRFGFFSALRAGVHLYWPAGSLLFGATTRQRLTPDLELRIDVGGGVELRGGFSGPKGCITVSLVGGPDRNGTRLHVTPLDGCFAVIERLGRQVPSYPPPWLQLNILGSVGTLWDFRSPKR